MRGGEDFISCPLFFIFSYHFSYPFSHAFSSPLLPSFPSSYLLSFPFYFPSYLPSYPLSLFLFPLSLSPSLSFFFSQFDAIVTDPPYSKREKAVTFDSPTTPSSNVSTSFSTSASSSSSSSSSSVMNSIAALSVQERSELRKGRDRLEEGVQGNGENGERRQGKYGDVKRGKRVNRGVEINSTRNSSATQDSSSSPMGDAFATTSCLLALASYRLKKG